MKKFIVKQSAKLKDFTDTVYPQGSFYYSALLRSGDIRVNGVKVRSNATLNPGDEIVYYTTQKMESKRSHSTIYEDEFLYVADKFSGVSTEALATEIGMIPVHRLDRNTCGVIVFAADERTAAALESLFRGRRVTKHYVCICKDNFRVASADMTAYLAKDDVRGVVKISDMPAKGYVPIRTEYEVIERRGELAMVNITLHTGKTHQIRAHMAHIGCPVLGDQKYGDEELNKKYGIKRQQLCAYELAFEYGGKMLCFKSSLAPGFPHERD